ncbi:MAG: rhodanese-like domain-containing protein [Acidimicrobiia bacterium]|nr:rhodanese-like domain-containing protein [Acidimicrobiia bacterium]
MRHRRSIDDLMAAWTGRVGRLNPRSAANAAVGGALLIDTRSQDDIRRHGAIPGALQIPLSVLPWRVDMDSDYRDRRITDLDQDLILLCMDGYSSLWAASLLIELGFRNVTDVAGGFRAWLAGGLPVLPPRV